MKVIRQTCAHAGIRRYSAVKSLLIALLLCAVLSSAVLAKPKPPRYRIYPLRNGVCKIAGDHAYYKGDNAETYEFALFIWLILGGEKPMLVDAGISNIEEMNRGAAHVLREPISQRKDETIHAQLAKFGLEPEHIGHIFITHLHFDHVDDLLKYKNAKVYVGRREWEGALKAAPNWAHGKILHEFSNTPDCKKRLVVVDDEEIMPGVEAFWVGGHTPGSTAYCVNTPHGKAVLTGDTVSLLGNIEKDIPGGVYTNLDECMAAMKKIRKKADIVLPSHDPAVLKTWPPVPKGTPKYTIRTIKVGQCRVRDYITFQDIGTEVEETSTYYLYIWVIEGGPKPIVVETGPKHPDEFSKSTAKYIPGGIKQLPSERTIEALKRNGIDPAEVSHVVVTHMHADHYDYFDAFPNAKLVVNKREYKDMTDGRDRLAPDVRKAINARPKALKVIGDNEKIAPGIRGVQLGCHTPGSQGILVQTWMGPVLLAGDVVYKYENIEKDRPIRSPDPQICRDAMKKIRSLADIVVPAHDPLTLQRWPNGIIGGLPPSGSKKVSSMNLITEDNISQPLNYAIDRLSSFCRKSAAINVSKNAKTETGLTVLLGKGPAEKYASTAVRDIDWPELGKEGFVLRVNGDGEP
jgi:glyoxylase-like metal-dependent hydrolase (beta-lactamase superfamily II)